MPAEELQLTSCVRSEKLFQHQPAEQFCEHEPWQKEPGLARHPPCVVARDAAARYDHVDVWMVGERRAPGVQNGCDADTSAQVFRIACDREHRLG